MAMTREFSWNRNSGDTLEAAAKAFELAQAAASEEYWKERDREDAMQAAVEAQKADVGARYPGLVAPTGTPTGAPSEAYQQAKAEQDAAIAQKVARLKELEMARAAKIAKFRDNPNFKAAAMLAMAGQPGALQAMLTEGSKPGKTQDDMDQLEKSIMADIFAISSTKDKNQRDKLIKMAQEFYTGQLQDMLKANPGLVSRLGGVEGLNRLLGVQIGKANDADAKAKAAAAAAASAGADY